MRSLGIGSIRRTRRDGRSQDKLNRRSLRTMIRNIRRSLAIGSSEATILIIVHEMQNLSNPKPGHTTGR